MSFNYKDLLEKRITLSTESFDAKTFLKYRNARIEDQKKNKERDNKNSGK